MRRDRADRCVRGTVAHACLRGLRTAARQAWRGAGRCDFLVVDEAHWLADEDRGHAWTRLLLSGAHTDVHVCAAPEAEDLLRELFVPGTDITVVRHARHGALSRTEEFRAASLPSASVVVAFSRKAVLALHRELLEAGRSATALCVRWRSRKRASTTAVPAGICRSGRPPRSPGGQGGGVMMRRRAPGR
ncbi:hypothetical protein [Streptomyces sp. T028]|uniref:hypothetical protein n=1 Tax=Streptomyces sp. T028 TaxID=3394379 RepID=UPI003A85ABEB